MTSRYESPDLRHAGFARKPLAVRRNAVPPAVSGDHLRHELMPLPCLHGSRRPTCGRTGATYGIPVSVGGCPLAPVTRLGPCRQRVGAQRSHVSTAHAHRR
jgi:hypothetical protein